MNSESNSLYVRVLNDHRGYFIKPKRAADDTHLVATVSAELPIGEFETPLGATQFVTTCAGNAAVLDLLIDGQLRALGAVVWDATWADEIWPILLRTHQDSLLACNLSPLPLPPPPPHTPWLVITFTPTLFEEWPANDRLLAISLFAATAEQVRMQQMAFLN